MLEPRTDEPGVEPESVLHAEVAREHDGEARTRLQESIRARSRTRWRPPSATGRRCERVRSSWPRGIDRCGAPVEPHELGEVEAFLHWVADDHFTFLGYREYDLVKEDGKQGLRARAGSGLGILRADPKTPFKPLRAKATSLPEDPHPLILTKANARSTVHRPSQLDYIGIKRFDETGRTTGEARFLGLYTTSAYRESPREIPLLRGKFARVLDRAGFPEASHDQKALIEVLESYPRDALFQMSADDLFTVAAGLVALGERPRVRLFVWQDPLDRFVACLVTIPRDRFNTESRERIGRILLEEFGGSALDWTLQLSESLLVRVHYIVRCPEGIPGHDVTAIEMRLAAAARAWVDDLRDALIAERGEEDGISLLRAYNQAFPVGYRSDWSAEVAVS